MSMFYFKQGIQRKLRGMFSRLIMHISGLEDITCPEGGLWLVLRIGKMIGNRPVNRRRSSEKKKRIMHKKSYAKTYLTQKGKGAWVLSILVQWSLYESSDSQTARESPTRYSVVFSVRTPYSATTLPGSGPLCA